MYVNVSDLGEVVTVSADVGARVETIDLCICQQVVSAYSSV